MNKILSIVFLTFLSLAGSSSYAQLKNHGPQVFAATIQGSQFLKDKDGKEYVFTVARGLPGQFVGYELNSGKMIVQSTLPGTDGAWDMEKASDNTIYISGNGMIYSYSLGDTKVKELGEVLPNQKVVWDLVAGKNGKIYGGTYPDCLVFEYHPNTGFKEVSMGAAQEGENYVRSLAFHPKSEKLYVGVGTHAGLIELDLNKRTKKQLLSEKYKNHEFVYDMQLITGLKGGDRLFAWINSSNFTGTFVYNLKTGKYEMELPDLEAKTILKDPKSNKVFYTSRGKLMQIDFADAKPIARQMASINGTGRASSWTSDGRFAVITSSNRVNYVDLKQNKVEEQELAIPKAPISIQTIFWGPDNKVWSAGYLAGQHGTYDPQTDKHTDYPGLHQTEGMNNFGNKLYFGIYAKAYLYSYDLTQPWDVKTSNPKYIGQIKEQDRPFAVLPLKARQEMLFGTVPGYGKLGGAITQLDVNTDKYETYVDLIPNQSIVSLIEYKGKVIGGSSISGGLGAIPTETKGRIFEWDPATKKVVWEKTIDDFWSVSGLFVGPDGELWGFADGTLFQYDLDQKRVTYKLPIYTYQSKPSHIWRNGLAVSHPNGLIYLTCNDVFYSFDIKSKKLTTIKDNASLMILGTNNKVYFRQGTDLWSFTPDGF